MVIGILKESGTEKRVAMLPGEVAIIKKLGVDIMVETGAGNKAWASDTEYISAGASIAERRDLISKSSFLLCVNPPLEDKADSFSEGQVICSVVNPVDNSKWLEDARVRGLTILALDLI